MPSIKVFICHLSWLSSIASAWILDYSCNNYRDIIVQAFENANVYATYGSKGLDVATRPNDPSLPFNSGQVNAWVGMTQYLFNAAFGEFQSGRNEPMIKAQSIFSNVLAVFEPEVWFRPKDSYGVRQDGSSLRREDLVVYCDYSHIKDGRDADGKVTWTDLDRGGTTFNPSDKDIASRSSCEDPKGGTQAVTIPWTENIPNVPQQMHVCASELRRYTDGGAFHWVGRDFNALTGGDNVQPEHQIKSSSRKPVDAAEDIGLVVLHELTHLYPMLTEDGRDGDDSGKPKYDAYGWIRSGVWARDVSGVGSIAGTLTNADNYAYFGFVSYFINGGTGPGAGVGQKKPMRVTDDGRFVIIRPGRSRKE